MAGEKWETWEPYQVLLVKNVEGVMEINAGIDAQVAELDALTPEEELDVFAIDEAVGESETVALHAGDRVLRDLGDGEGNEEGGWRVGSVQQISEATTISVMSDGSRDAQARRVVSWVDGAVGQRRCVHGRARASTT